MKIFLGFIFCICLVPCVTAQHSLRIMSYNIHHGVGMDDQADYGRIA